MSRVRTHFCTLVARFHGGGFSPRKYGLNGTMPALTSSSVGSSAISDADGTTACPRLSKTLSPPPRISGDSLSGPLFRWCAAVRRGAVRFRGRRGGEPQRLVQ